MAVFTGTSNNDSSIGTGVGDAMTGGAGQEVLVGAGGDDVIDGGPDFDQITADGDFTVEVYDDNLGPGGGAPDGDMRATRRSPGSAPARSAARPESFAPSSRVTTGSSTATASPTSSSSSPCRARRRWERQTSCFRFGTDGPGEGLSGPPAAGHDPRCEDFDGIGRPFEKSVLIMGWTAYAEAACQGPGRFCRIADKG